MNKLVDLISEQVAQAFEAAGFDRVYGKTTVSNRPDLCEFQCNGSLQAAKQYKTAPIQIAQAVVEQLQSSEMFTSVEACMPGFINLKLSNAYLSGYLCRMQQAEQFGLQTEAQPKTIVIDYGGPNVAKPLHVGHLRSAIIGESIKRVFRYFGNNVIGDIHLGDWGLQMGLIIAELQHRQPELPYFDPDFSGDYPAEAPFTISELEEIYPTASGKSKEDEAFAKKAHDWTRRLQEHEPGCMALWHHIMRISKADLKKNYNNLEVSFDKWFGESDAQRYIAPMIENVKQQGLTVESEGALVIPVEEETDKKPVPPCILVKSDGATLYATTDLATLVQREADFNPDLVLYVVDKRQQLHFEQVFRAARKSGIVKPDTGLRFLGFGTMNGKDGKPFKTREGGVMRLDRLISETTDYIYQKICDNQTVETEQMQRTAQMIAIAALKYGDLINQPSKDYIFDLDRFSAFEGNTGPYLLYTIVRLKSILGKYNQPWQELSIQEPDSEAAKNLMLSIARFSDNLQAAYSELAPNLICAYAYELAGYVNSFYHGTRILAEPDADKQAGYIALVALAKSVLETCIDMLGFQAPDKM